MTQFGINSTGKEVVEAFAKHAEGKTIVITGPSAGGIGAYTATSLAYANPKLIILAGRTESKVTPVIEEIHKLNPKIKTKFIQLDLASQVSVRKSAEEINASVEKIDILINNAGILLPPTYKATPEGVELQFGTNHLGHFLLTNLLMDKILAAGKGARIVNVSSMGYFLGEVPFDDINWQNGKTYSPWHAYAGSKTANILFNVSLAEKLKSKGVIALAIHPGMPNSNLAVDVSQELYAEGWKISTARNGGVPMDMAGDDKSLEASCSTTLAAALDPQFEEHSGAFIRNCQLFNDIEEYATKPEYAQKLWKLSEELVKQEFNL